MSSVAARLNMAAYVRQRLIEARDFAAEALLPDQRRFDELHERRHWDFDDPVERERYVHVLDAVKAHREKPILRALEVGCAAGVFTSMLALCAASVVATDVSPVACNQTRQRIATLPHVTVQALDVLRDKPPGQFDAVFAMDTLELLKGPWNVAKAARKLCEALQPGGLLALTCCDLQPANYLSRILAAPMLNTGRSAVAYLDGRWG